MEELLESEVMWPENHYDYTIDTDTNSDNKYHRTRSSHHRTNDRAPSSPIAIPRSTSSSSLNDSWCNEDEYSELVPPHVLVARRSNASGMAFSSGSGHGRTLKGRDLQQLRNAVWKMTGFLDG